jgi:hypothetical protein
MVRALVLTCICIASLILVTIVSVSRWYEVKSNCTDYLKLAGDAPNIQKAQEFLGKAINYLEQKNLTQGNSAIFFKVPSSDIGIWYGQIRGAYESVNQILLREGAGSIGQIEKDNALMKIREVVLDNSSSGTSVTHPNNISWYPNQLAIFIWWALTVIIGVVAVIFWFILD